MTSPVNSQDTNLLAPAENLRRIEEGHNDFEPTTGYLGPASAAEAPSDDSPSEKGGKGRFVGGFKFMAGLRHAMRPRWKEEPEPDPYAAQDIRGGWPVSADAGANHQYAAQSPAQQSMMQSPAIERWEYPVSPRYDETPYDPPIPPAPAPDPVPPQTMSPPTSETHHATHDMWDGTTAVHQDVRPDPPHVPVYPYPMQTAYAKPNLDTPAAQPGGQGGHMSRIRNFFRELNDLPWIAPDRITVDYVPGRLKQTDSSQPANGPLTWYGGPPDARYVGMDHRYSGAATVLSSPSDRSIQQPREMAQNWGRPPVARAPPPPQPDAVPAAYYGNVQTPSPEANVVDLGEPTVRSGWGTYPTGYVNQASNSPAAYTMGPGSTNGAKSPSPSMAQYQPMPAMPRPQPTYPRVPMKGIPPPP